ncbi:hypothetical protein [Nocardia thailandica]|nr:hypothetical protein [Nocardia thailandica]
MSHTEPGQYEDPPVAQHQRADHEEAVSLDRHVSRRRQLDDAQQTGD